MHHDVKTKQYYDMYLKELGEGICTFCKTKETGFIGLKVGYLRYCSMKCSSSSTSPGRVCTKKTRNKIRAKLIESHKSGKFPILRRQQKMKDTILQRYGVDHVSRIPGVSDKVIETRSRNNNYGIWKDHFLPTRGKNEKQILDIQERRDNCVIVRDYRVGRYWPDGYCKESNTVYEVYESHHKYKQDYDVKRQSYIQHKLNCKFVILSEQDFLETISLEKI